MNNNKIYKIVIIGSIILNLPYFISLYYIFSFIPMKDVFFNVLILSAIYLSYWSFFVPKYKLYSVKYLNTKEEYRTWYKFSLYGFIICPKKSFFKKMECWNKDDHKKYKLSIKRLDYV